MLRVRIRRRPADHRAAARDRRDQHPVRPRHRRRHRPAEHPAALDPGRGRPGDLGAARGRRPDRRPRRAATPRASSSARRSPASPPTRSSTAPRRSRRSATAGSATRSSPTCRASSRRPSPGTPRSTSRTRSTTSRSSASCTPSTAPASTSGSAAACRPTRCFAQRLGAWVPLEEVPEVWEGVVSIFRDYGYRRLRTRARLKFLVADWGPEKFRQVLQDEYLGRALLDGPPPAHPADRRRDHVGVHRQKDGRVCDRRRPARRPGQRHDPGPPGRARRPSTARVGCGSPRSRSSSCSTSTRRPRRDARRRPGRDRPAADAQRVPPRRPWPAPASSSASWPSSRPRHARACTSRAGAPAARTSTSRSRINVNGCPNSCARFQVADIGLKG